MLQLDNDKKRVLLAIAKDAIKSAVTKEPLIDRAALIKKYPWLTQKGAVFVTINKQHRLRGCIGSIIAHRSLIDDVIENAKSAALHDPRFSALRADELENISVEVSVLTPPKELVYTDISDLKKKIQKGSDGVIINYNGYQATYLPSVWEQLPTFDGFFSTLCQKAGLSQDCLKLHPSIYTYKAIKISDS